MPIGGRGVVAPALGLLFLLGALLVDIFLDIQLSGVYATAVILASISSQPRRTAAVAGLAITAAFSSGVWHGTLGEPAWSIRFLSCVVASGASVLAAHLAARLLRRMRHTSGLAQELLDALAVELTGARSVIDVAEAFLGKSAERLGAASANIYQLNDDRMLEAVSWFGRGGPEADQYAVIPLDADLPGALAVRTGVALHLPDRVSIIEAFPELASYYPEDRSLHVLPLMHEGMATGLLALTFPMGVIESEEERGFLGSLAGALSAAMQRAKALAVRDAEVGRAELLAETSRVLSRSLDWDETLEEVRRLLVPRLSDWCSLHLLRGETLETTALWHRDADTSAWAQDMLASIPTDMSAPTGAGAVVRTGEPELHVAVPDELMDAAVVDETHAALLKRLGLVSAVVAPLCYDDEAIGAVSLAYAESARRYGPEDLELLVDISSLIATALSNADNYTRQSKRLTEVMRVAAAAQQAILAPPPAQVGPFALSARYVSAVEEAQIGGDLYEVAALPDRLRLLVGDGRGKGLEAIRTATVVLGGFRSLAVLDISIEELARQLDKHVQVYLDDDEDFVTAALVDVDHEGRFSLVLCGHPAPVMLRGTRWEVLDATPSLPLGLGATPEPTVGQMSDGDRLVLFTDGLLEARQGDRSFIDPDPLWDLALSTPFAQQLDSLLDAVRHLTGAHLQDDLALLSVEYRKQATPQDREDGSPVSEQLDSPSALQRTSYVLPLAGTSAGQARRLVRSLLESTSMEAVSDDAQLAVSELVTNALVHAGSEIHLTLALTGSGLRVDVADASTHLPVRRDYGTSSGTGRGLHLMDSLVTRWDTIRLGNGKVVWFEIEDPAGLPFASPDQEPLLEENLEASAEVTLLNVPLLMHAAWHEHASALLREYLLMRLGDDPEILERHSQSSDAMNLLHEQVPTPELGAAPEVVMSLAVEPQVSAAALTLRVPHASVAHFAVLNDLIDEALTAASAGQLLVPPTQPEIRQMSRWLCQEVLAQARDARSPAPWKAVEHQQITDPELLRVEGWDASQVNDSTQALLATNEASVIVAVSASALGMLGYASPDELTGRPVTCIVPERYQQAHVAGTTLHVSNGRDPLLNLAITVPVVRADGQEALHELTVRPHPLPGGARLFVAEFTQESDAAVGD